MSVFIELDFMGKGWALKYGQEEQKLVADNLARLAKARVPKCPEDIRVEDLVVPLELHWRRGPCLVKSVSLSGVVTTRYAARPDFGGSAGECDGPWYDWRIVS